MIKLAVRSCMLLMYTVLSAHANSADRLAPGGGGPLNDFCADVVAEPLAIGANITFTGDNTGATFVGDAEPGSQMDLGLPSVWHAFTLSGCASVTVRYCGISPAFANTWNWLATNCPASSLVNATTFNTTSCGDGNKTLSFISLPAGTYYLPVLADPFNNSQGPYSISVSAAACPGSVPTNDLCTSVAPQALALGATLQFFGDNTGATFEGDAVPGSVMDLGLSSVWHAFTTTECLDVAVRYCGINPVYGNTWNWLATSCPAAGLINASSFNTTDCGDGNKTLYFNELPAGTYYLPILNDAFNGAQGPYNISVFGGTCGGVPINDLCTSVSPQGLVLGSTLTFTGSTTAATAAGDATPGSPMDLGLPSVWHAFTTTSCAIVTVSYCGINPAYGNTWNWLALNCPANSVLNATSFNTTTCGDGNKTLIFDQLPAGTYYLPVLNDPFNNATGPYSIAVSAASCTGATPENDLCSALGAPVPVAIGSPAVFNGNSTGATLDDDAVPGSIIAQVGLPNVWHYFSLPECSDLSVKYCGTSPAFSNVWNLLATSCPANELVFSASNNTTDCGDGNRTTYYEGVPAGNYYLPVLVDPFSGSVGPYTVTVTATQACDVSIAEHGFDWGLIQSQGGNLRINTGSLSGPVRWELLDAAGRTLSSTYTFAQPGTEVLISTEGSLSQGIYILQAVHADGRSAKRVLLP